VTVRTGKNRRGVDTARQNFPVNAHSPSSPRLRFRRNPRHRPAAVAHPPLAHRLLPPKAKQAMEFPMSLTAIGGALSLLSLFAPSKAGAAKESAAVEFFREQAGEDTATSESAALKKAPEQDFLDYAKMSVPERIRKSYLEQEGLTEEQLAQLDTETRKKIEDDIREKIEESIKKETGRSIGGIANLLV
jgi:hypothetical protein